MGGGAKINLPIGSLYYNKTNINMSDYFEGTWQRVKDTFILAVGDTYKENTSGGEATHTLTIDEMPSHNHNVYNNGRTDMPIGMNNAIVEGYTGYNMQYNYPAKVDNILSTNYKGGGAAHNNMPPYKTYYCWERIA